MKDILIQIGPLTIYSYGFFVAMGVLAGYYFLMHSAAKERLETADLSNIAIWSLLSGLLCAHLTYVFLNLNYFIENPKQMLDLRTGFVFAGGLIGGLGTGFILLKKLHFNVLQVMDLAAPGFAIAYSLGRIGCYLHGCCYGLVSHSVWGVCFPPDSPAGYIQEPRLPIQLLSSLISVVLFVFLLIIRDQKRFMGQVFYSYLILYSITRAGIEFLRDEHYKSLGFLDIGQWAYLGIAVVGVILYIKTARGSTGARGPS